MKISRRCLTMMLILTMLISSVFTLSVSTSASDTDTASTGAWSQGYNITGNGAKDIVSVGYAQVGKTKAELGIKNNKVFSNAIDNKSSILKKIISSTNEKTMTYDSTERAYIITLTASETATLTAGEQYWFDIGIQIQDTFQRLIKLEELKVIPGIARAVTS